MPKKILIKTSLLSCFILFGLAGCNPSSTPTSSQQEISPANIEKSKVETSKKKARLTAKDLPHYSKRDIKDEVFYFVLPDRFHNGDLSNDNGSKTNAISAGGFDKTRKDGFHGGDIQGLNEKLPYLQEMGITSIWLTPILRNQAMQGELSGYHGYWVLDFTEIDPHLGTNADLKAFIDSAHQRNIKVFFDIITNHTADVIKYTECHGEDGSGWSEGGELCPYKSLADLKAGDRYTTIIPKGMENVKSPAWLNDPKYYHNQGDSTFEGENSIYGDFFGLDDTNTDDPVVVDGMIDIFKNIIDQFKPDGFRIDTVKHVNIEFWQSFAPALVTHANNLGIDNFFMFGEVYSGDSKELSKYVTEGKMQSVLDFAFQGTVQNTLINQQGTDKFVELFSQDHLYKTSYSDANQLLNFVGNHDMGRFAFHLKESEHNYSEAEQIKRQQLAHALMFFARGVPVIYYGDEQGFVGDGGNHDARQDMMPSEVVSFNDDNLLATTNSTADDNFDTTHPLYQVFADYADIYHQYPALRKGEHKTLYSQNTPGIYAFSRIIADDGIEHIVVANTSTVQQSVNIDVDGVNFERIYPIAVESQAINVSDKKLNISVPPLTFSIYQAK